MTADAERVRELAVPLVAAEDLDLVEVALKGSGPQRVLRVTVDAKGGVDLGRCQRVASALSAALDDADPISGTYRLEVTSPGVDRPLRDRSDFDRVEGRPVRIRVTAHDAAPDSTAEVAGTVRAAEDDAVVIDVDGEALRVPYDDIETATQALPW